MITRSSSAGGRGHLRGTSGAGGGEEGDGIRYDTGQRRVEKSDFGAGRLVTVTGTLRFFRQCK